MSILRHTASFAIQEAHKENSDQTGQMRRLIWIFAGRSLKVYLRTFRLICYFGVSTFIKLQANITLEYNQGARKCMQVVSVALSVQIVVIY